MSCGVLTVGPPGRGDGGDRFHSFNTNDGFGDHFGGLMVVARLMSASMFGIVWCRAADGCLGSTGHGVVKPLVGHMSNKEQRHRFELGRAAGDVPVFTTHQY